MAAKRPPREKLPMPAVELMAFEEPKDSPTTPQTPAKAPAAAVEAPTPAVVPAPPAVVTPAVSVAPVAVCAHCGIPVAKPVTVRRVSPKGVVTFETFALGHRSDRG